MKSIQGVGLSEVTSIYGGAQGDLYTPLLGQQLHVGGLEGSLDLAERAGIGDGLSGTDLSCGTAGGIRALLRFRNVTHMVGIDATASNIERGLQRCREEVLADRVGLVVGDASSSGLRTASTDFIWGEDAWCYIVDKPKLIAEAARLVRPEGVIAFTDWVEGSAELSGAEAEKSLRLMSFPNIEDIAGYTRPSFGMRMRSAHGGGHRLLVELVRSRFQDDRNAIHVRCSGDGRISDRTAQHD